MDQQSPPTSIPSGKPGLKISLSKSPRDFTPGKPSLRISLPAYVIEKA